MELGEFLLSLRSLVFLLLFVSSLSYSAEANSAPLMSNTTDLAALLAFKKGVISDPLGILSTNWTTNTSFCNWFGISCSHRRDRVTAIRLRGLSLGGTIHPSLANLSFLSYLNLENNSLVGPIPDSLGRLPRLKLLSFYSNRLTGPVPIALLNMSSLSTISLAYNNLSGSLPLSNRSDFTLLPRLRWISLTQNQLTGEIPSSFGRCRGLQELSLSFNHFTGQIPSELGSLPELTSLLLGVNNLTGVIPPSLCNLTKLQRLDLMQNNLHGEIPSDLGNLVSLRRLNLALNHLTGPIPASLSNASMLDLLQLSFNNLSGEVPMVNMPLLTTFILQTNQLSGGLDFITSLSKCRSLMVIEVSYNQLEGTIPDSVGNFSENLLYFYADSNRIKGEVPAAFGNLSSLLTLALFGNKLVGRIPPELGRIEKLQQLYLGHNRLHGSIPWELGRLTNLIEIFLAVNSLSESVPESIGNLTKLQNIDISHNALSSAIPRSFGNLRNLLHLDLSNNNLSGVVPSELGNLKVLYLMDLSANRFTGSIPSTLGELQMLQNLTLSHNSFQGPIPESLGKLISIQKLDLSHNSLSGAIPKSFVGLRYLNTLNLSFNKLEGQIPKGGAFSNVSSRALMGNMALCGGAPRLRFPPCSDQNATHVASRKVLRLLRYILPATAVILAVLTCFSIILILCSSRRRRRISIAKSAPDNSSHMKDFRFISYHELVRATDNFNESNLLGRGSFGSVFRGQLDDGLLTAVKVLNMETEGASQSFEAECRALSLVRHRNLVKIISICSNLDFKALVLQFMPNGSLERWLYSHNYCLSLLQRLNIVLDVALALEYLHHRSHQVVIHCDLKPSNVLLDEDMTAHVTDFGIAKLLFGDSSRSAVSTLAPGTIGYIPPEYGSTGKVSKKGDVYSFGILVLETFTRKRPTDAMFVESDMRQWVSEAHPGAVLDIVDCNLIRCVEDHGASHGKQIMEDPDGGMHQCLSSVIELGLLCSESQPKERILMKDVVPRLQKIKTEYLSRLQNISNHYISKA